MLYIILPLSSFPIFLRRFCNNLSPYNGAEIGFFPGALSLFTREVRYKVQDSPVK